MTTTDPEESRLKEELISASRFLLELDLAEFRGGNLSARIGDDVLITRRRSTKALTSLDDIIRTSLAADDENAASASSALEIHRAIYLRTDAKVVVHAHPQMLGTLSFFMDTIKPVDENGLLIAGPEIPVVAAPVLFGWNLVADELAEALVENRVVMLKWHGTFAKGDNLEDAIHRTRSANWAAAHIIRLAQLREHFGEPVYPPKEVAVVSGGIARRGLPKVSEAYSRR